VSAGAGGPVHVHDLAYALGSRAQTVEEAERAGLLLSGAAALKEAGFHRHHVCPPEETAYDLAKRAVEQIRPRLRDVSAIVYCTCLPVNGSAGGAADLARFEQSRDVKHLMDFPASHLQADLGLERAQVLGLNQQACTSMLGSLAVARALLAAEPAWSQVLCVSADRFPAGARYEQTYNLISDGAAACLVSREPRGLRLLATHAVTNGAMARAGDDETAGSYFSYAHRVIHETAARAGISLSEVDWIVPQNTHAKAWLVLSRLLKIDPERVYGPSGADTGHVISADNVINLKHLLDSGRARRGQKVLLFMAGYGLNWSCALLEVVG
jgi:3-oxoacyl-[acyl-carrier-protein] synthase III